MNKRPDQDSAAASPDAKTPHKGAAGGLAAIASTFKHGLEKMGPLRTVKTLLRVNQEGGFDCPGCAWPDPQERSMAEFCENGAKAIADEAMTKRVTPAFFAARSIDGLYAESDHWLNRQGRLVHPMVRRAGATNYEPISWDDAFALIAAELNALESPDEAAFYTSGRTSNEAAFLYQLFVRQLGTNNLPDCSNMCHESSGTGLGEVIGVGKGTVTLEDFDEADAIFVIGQNPGTNHPRMLTTLQSAARRGCEIVSINPLKEPGLTRFKHPQEVLRLAGPGTPIASLHVPVQINGDVALLKGIMKAMLEAEDAQPGSVLDRAFIEAHTHGFEAFEAALRAADWAALIAQSGINRAMIQAAADVAMRSERMICCWAMGLTQHKNGVANIQEVVNLLLLRGHIGRPGAGACPVRGHSNVQGDRTMGIWERAKPEFLDALGAEFGFEPPREHGLDTVETIKAMHDGRVKVFFAMGGNFLSAAPDTAFTEAALRRCRLTVQVSTKLNRSHVAPGEVALILPCLGRTEVDLQASGPQFVTVENSMGVVHTSRGDLEPASPVLLSEPAIVARLAHAALGERSAVDWLEMIEDYDRIRDSIARVVAGCEDYNHRVRQRGGFLLANAARDRVFNTATGKAQFSVHPLPELDLPEGMYLMMTIRSHDQYNTTIYSLDDRYRGVKGQRRVVLIDRDDLRRAGLREGQRVDLVSHFRGETRRVEDFALIAHPLPPRCVATYFPEANPLVAVDSVAERSNTPASKSVIISIEPREEATKEVTQDDS